MKSIPKALMALAEYDQFLCWKGVPRADGGTDKLPLDPKTGQVCDAHDASKWVSAAEACATGMKVAFVFTDMDPFYFLDVDHCVTPDGQWTANAVALCNKFAGSAIEISQSGKGMHMFGRQPLRLSHGSDCKSIGSQFYTTKRFVALTGDGLVGDAGFTPDPVMYSQFLAQYFPPRSLDITGEDWTSGPDPLWDGPEEDAELIKRMLKAKSARGILGVTATLRQLWEADADALGKVFPDDAGAQGRAFDWSLADAALCSHLAFWTGKNCERMDVLFQQSALVRSKWLDRTQYKTTTILKAVAGCKRVYKQRKPADAIVAQDPSLVRPGFQYYTIQDQVNLFQGCCYVQDIHKVFTPDGSLLKPDQFKVHFGGYVFSLDSMGDKTSRNAWEIFTESQAHRFPRVHTTCFRPELEPGEIVNREGELAVNTYVPAPTNRQQGDPAPFLGFLNRILPDPHDQAIILAYMAACVQHIGVKFQWAPLLQGTEGNGKSFIGRCLTKAVGEKYTHKVNPKDIGNVFNSWLTGKLLILIEEVHTQDKVDTIETLKWMITDERVPLQAKGQGQITGDNRANFFMSSNHLDAIKKTIHDRRFCVFYTAQQEFSDLEKYGMSGSYFPNLYNWAKNQGGYAIVTQYLATYAIPPELNPAVNCTRAPVTSSTNAVIISSQGIAEQEIIEAIESDKPGFMGGWISSLALGRLLEEKRIHVPLNIRRRMLKDLGYVAHPSLTDGRANSVIPSENGKPRLFAKIGGPAERILMAAEVLQEYQAAQGYVIVS